MRYCSCLIVGTCTVIDNSNQWKPSNGLERFVPDSYVLHRNNDPVAQQH